MRLFGKDRKQAYMKKFLSTNHTNQSSEAELEEDHIVSHTWGLSEKKPPEVDEEQKWEQDSGNSDRIILDIMDRPYNQVPDDCSENLCGCNDVSQTSEFLMDGNYKNLAIAQSAVSGIALTVQGRLQNQYADFMHGCTKNSPHFDNVSTEGSEAYESFKSMAADLVKHKNKHTHLILGDESEIREEENIECVPPEIWDDIGDEEEGKHDCNEIKAISVGELLSLLEV